MFRGQWFAYSENLRLEHERKSREKYWEKFFENAKKVSKGKISKD
ncbi:MAG: hypothetical protein ACXAB2_09190 [Candidatus Hodarchaeales archaeon]|jgi:hypothetical protein